MMGIRQEILDRSNDYDVRAKAGEMYLIERHEAGLGDVAAKDLISNYTSRMVRKQVPARAVYDALKALPRNNRCPFCNYGPVETLDHVLPKELYPGFSVKPTNLVEAVIDAIDLKEQPLPLVRTMAFCIPISTQPMTYCGCWLR